MCCLILSTESSDDAFVPETPPCVSHTEDEAQGRTCPVPSGTVLKQTIILSIVMLLALQLHTNSYSAGAMFSIPI